MMAEKPDSLTMPLNWVIVAGFQNIDESEPPAATPANDVPCPYVLCSRIAKAPAFACAVAMIRIPSAVPARSIPIHRDIDWPPAPTLAQSDCDHREPRLCPEQ